MIAKFCSIQGLLKPACFSPLAKIVFSLWLLKLKVYFAKQRKAFIAKLSFVVKHWQKMVQSACGYRIRQSILAVFGIFKLPQKRLKLQLKLEMSCQTLVKYILEYEIFQNLRLLVITESNQVITFAEDFMYYIRQV